MSGYERPFEVHDPSEKLGHAMLQLGLRPELVAELAPDEARLMIGAVAKTLNMLIHPDRGGREDVFGLRSGDVNYLNALVAQADNSLLEKAINNIQATNVVVGTARHNRLLGRELDHLTNVSKDLAYSVIFGGESLGERLSMSFLLHEPDLHNPMNPTPNVIYVRIQNGVVIEASQTQARGSLLSALPIEAQMKLQELRPNLNDAEQYVCLDTLFPGDETLTGWAKLVTATSRSDQKSKKSAIKFYDTHYGDAHDLADLLGARIIGTFDYERVTNTAFTLSIDTPIQAKTLERAGIDSSISTYSIIGNEDLAHLLGRGSVKPIRKQHDVAASQRLVFHKGTNQGHGGTNFITTDIVACAVQ